MGRRVSIVRAKDAPHFAVHSEDQEIGRSASVRWAPCLKRRKRLGL